MTNLTPEQKQVLYDLKKWLANKGYVVNCCINPTPLFTITGTGINSSNNLTVRSRNKDHMSIDNTIVKPNPPNGTNVPSSIAMEKGCDGKWYFNAYMVDNSPNPCHEVCQSEIDTFIDALKAI